MMGFEDDATAASPFLNSGGSDFAFSDVRALRFATVAAATSSLNALMASHAAETVVLTVSVMAESSL